MAALTVEDIKKSPLKRGQPLRHIVFGAVKYAGKVRNKPHRVNVEYVEMQPGVPDRKVRIEVPLAELTLAPKPSKYKQRARLVLARCEICDLRIRASMSVFQLGTPLCFNELCQSKGGPLTIEVQKWDDEVELTDEEIRENRREAALRANAEQRRADYKPQAEKPKTGKRTEGDNESDIPF